MRLASDSYHGARSKTRRTAIFLFAAGSVFLVLGSFWLFMGILIIGSSHDLWDARAGMLCAGFAGVLPLAIALFLFVRAFAAMRRLSNLQALGGLAKMRPAFTARDIAETLQLDVRATERLVHDAQSLGVLLEDAPGTASTVTADSLVGALLNETYRIDGKLGQGGMGAVYVATHLRTGRRYAVKTLLPDVRFSDDAIRRFEREATAASALGHPGIVQVHDFDETPEHIHYLVMELLEGETLEARIERAGALRWNVARAIAESLGAALVAAHDAGILHRDLKPANVFLARDGSGRERVVLVDFGLAKPMDEKASRITSVGGVVGTPLYMPPEQARGADVDARSDLYSFAAVLYEMVVGVPPFADRTMADVYRKLLTEPAPPLADVAPHDAPSGLDPLLARALAKDPGARPSSMREFLAELSAL